MIMVTGGAGFIGSNIAALLAEQGQDVVICDALGVGDKWRNLAKIGLADFVPPQDLFSWLERNGRATKAVVHMAAISSTTEPDVDLIVRHNFVLSRALWSFCGERGLPFIYASSAATYGDGSAGFDDDFSSAALARLKPLNPYGWSKHLFDRYVATQIERKEKTPPQWVGLKFFNVYGPNEYHKGEMQSVIAKIQPQVAAGKRVTLFRSHHPKYADGCQMRDFIYVRDGVAVISWLLKTPSVSGLFNLGTGKARSFLDLAKAVFAATNQAPDIAFADTPEAIRARYQYFTEAKMDRLRTAGYRGQFTPLEDGVTHYVQNYLGAADAYR